MEKALTLFCVVAFFLTGCMGARSAKTWRLEPLCSVTGFKTPECAEVYPADGTVYVANVFALSRDAVKALDGNGFISVLEPGGRVKELKAIKGTAALPVHGASGMCFFNGYLYFNDRNNLKRCPLDDLSAVEVAPVPGTTSGFNDAACDDNFVYVSSSEGAIYRVDAQGRGGKFVDLEGVNGIKSWRGKLFAVTTNKEKSDNFFGILSKFIV